MSRGDSENKCLVEQTALVVINNHKHSGGLINERKVNFLCLQKPRKPSFLSFSKSEKHSKISALCKQTSITQTFKFQFDFLQFDFN